MSGRLLTRITGEFSEVYLGVARIISPSYNLYF
jgi:hypothetical protein